MIGELDNIRKVRPDICQITKEELDVMQTELQNDIYNYGFHDMIMSPH